VELRAPLQPGPATGAVISALRDGGGVEGPGPDRYLAPDIEAAYALVRGGAVVAAAETVTGPLA
jgi:histidine ammonia-lyase